MATTGLVLAVIPVVLSSVLSLSCRGVMLVAGLRLMTIIWARLCNWVSFLANCGKLLLMTSMRGVLSLMSISSLMMAWYRAIVVSLGRLLTWDSSMLLYERLMWLTITANVMPAFRKLVRFPVYHVARED